MGKRVEGREAGRMNKIGVAAMAAVVLLGVSGGAARAQPATLDQTLQRLDARLASIPHVSQSELLSDEKGARYRAVRTLIRDKQCASRTANPLLLLSVPMRVSLKEALDMPLHVATLADVPGEYMKETLALSEARGMPPEISAKVRLEAARNYEKLTVRVAEMLGAFDPSACRRM